MFAILIRDNSPTPTSVFRWEGMTTAQAFGALVEWYAEAKKEQGTILHFIVIPPTAVLPFLGTVNVAQLISESCS